MALDAVTVRGTAEWKAKISAAVTGKHKPRQQATCHPERKAKAFGLCTPCYRHQYYANNPQKESQRAHQWQVEHHDQAQAHKRHWRETHPQYDIEYRRIRRPQLRSQEREKNRVPWEEFRQWYQANKDGFANLNRHQFAFEAYKAGWSLKKKK